MQNIFGSVLAAEITLKSFLICMVCALVCGTITAVAAAFRARATKSFLVSLVLLPVIVHTVISMVNGSIGAGIAVMGAFSLVRFRSVPGKAKDIVYIFMSMTAGLTCATGYVAIAILVTLSVCLVTVVLSFIRIGSDEMLLKITVPETLNFANAFDDLFKQYTSKHYQVSVRTANMGSLYKLTYKVRLKDQGKMQEFIDELRCRNGNLEIMLTEPPETEEL